MAEEKSKFKLFLYGFLLGLMFFGMVRLILSGGGLFLRGELFGFMFLLILSLIGFMGYASHWGEKVFFTVFVLYLANLLAVWYFTKALYLVLLLLALIGFLISLPKARTKVIIPPWAEEPHSQVFEEKEESEQKEETEEPVVEIVEEPVAEVKKNEAKNEPKKVSAIYSPGKLIASSRSNVYHLPKCEWAKKIKKERRAWFKNAEEAEERGFRAHSCLQ